MTPFPGFSGLAPGGAASLTGASAVTAPAAVRLHGLVLASTQSGVLLDLSGRTVMLEGAPPLPPGSRVTVQLPPNGRFDQLPTPARLIGKDNELGGLPVLLRTTPDPAALATRPGPSLPATVLLPNGGEQPVALRIAPPLPSAAPPAPATPQTATEALTALSLGFALPALVQPRQPGSRLRLDIGGLTLRLEELSIELPAGQSVSVRLATPQPELAHPMGSRSPPATTIRHIPVDERLAAHLIEASALLAEPDDAEPAQRAERSPTGAAPYEGGLAALLGEATRPLPLRVDREAPRDRNAGAAPDSAPALLIDVTFERLGRMRLEVRHEAGGSLRLLLRHERALPPGAAAALGGIAGAAFELGRGAASFHTLAGPISIAPSRQQTA